jgi:ABC-type sulfate/molybdate transport systems ATPase subunit
MTLSASAAALGELRYVDLELSPGRYVAISTDRDALGDLVSLLTGERAPRRGRVLLEGAAPAQNPALRRHIAALLPNEALPPARTTLAAVSLALSARSEAPSRASEILESSGLSGLASSSRLTWREARSVALALALAHESAKLLALFEPLSTSLAPNFVLEKLDQHTERGAIVVCSTTNMADAMQLGGAILNVELGQLRGVARTAPRLGAGPWQQVLVESPDARALAQLLSDSTLGLTTTLEPGGGAFKLTGPALDVTVREALRLARESSLEITRIEPAVPSAEVLLGARHV